MLLLRKSIFYFISIHFNCKYLQCIFGRQYVLTIMICAPCFFCKTVCIASTKRTDLPFSTPGVKIIPSTKQKKSHVACILNSLLHRSRESKIGQLVLVEKKDNFRNKTIKSINSGSNVPCNVPLGTFLLTEFIGNTFVILVYSICL